MGGSIYVSSSRRVVRKRGLAAVRGTDPTLPSDHASVAHLDPAALIPPPRLTRRRVDFQRGGVPALPWQINGYPGYFVAADLVMSCARAASHAMTAPSATNATANPIP